MACAWVLFIEALIETRILMYMYLDNNKETQKWNSEMTVKPNLAALVYSYLLCVLPYAKVLHVPGSSIPLASSPGHSQILSRTPRLWDKIWEWPEAERGYHIPPSQAFPQAGNRNKNSWWSLASFPDRSHLQFLIAWSIQNVLMSTYYYITYMYI